MKVLFFSNIVPNKMGSYEIFCSRLGEALRKAGDSLVVVAGGKPIEPVCDEWKKSGISLKWIDGWTDGKGKEYQWRFVVPAVKMIRDEKPDVVVINFGNEKPSIICCLLARLSCRKKTTWIWQQHQQIRDPDSFTRHISKIRLLSFFFDKLITVYDGGRDSLIQRHVAESKIQIFYNAIEDQRPTEGTVKKDLGLPDDSMLITSVGSFIPRKRFDFLIEAFSISLKKMDKKLADRCRLLLIGDGCMKERLMSDVKRRGMEQQVIFAGLRNDVRQILSESSLYIHAALAETCTYTITESMCAGIPAVVTDAGAAREQIKDSETGYVLDKGDLDGFAGKICSLMDSPDIREKMGRAARQRWSERYQLKSVVDQYAAFMKRRMKFEG